MNKIIIVKIIIRRMEQAVHSGGFLGDVTNKRNLSRIQSGEGRELQAGKHMRGFRQKEDPGGWGRVGCGREALCEPGEEKGPSLRGFCRPHLGC